MSSHDSSETFLGEIFGDPQLVPEVLSAEQPAWTEPAEITVTPQEAYQYPPHPPQPARRPAVEEDFGNLLGKGSVIRGPDGILRVRVVNPDISAALDALRIAGLSNSGPSQQKVELLPPAGQSPAPVVPIEPSLSLTTSADEHVRTTNQIAHEKLKSGSKIVAGAAGRAAVRGALRSPRFIIKRFLPIAVLALVPAVFSATYKLGGGEESPFDLRHPFGTVNQLQADFAQVVNHPLATVLAQTARVGK